MAANRFSRMIPATFRKKKTAERMDQNTWAAMVDNYFSFDGMSYPIGYGPTQGDDRETPPNDFQSYVSGCYKTNAVVFACCMRRQTVFTDMRFAFRTRKNGTSGKIFGSKNLAVLENPWPNGTTGELLARALQDTDLAGNFYVVKEGTGSAKKPYRLRRLRPDWVDIILTAPPETAVQSDVAGYCYKPGGTEDPAKWVIYPIDGTKGAIAHWSPIPDPDAQYRGMSWITPIIHEILADKGATLHKQKFFDQGATPQLAVSFKESVSPEDFKKFMKDLNRNHEGANNAYKTMYLAGGADVTVVGAHLAQIDFQITQGHGETRIAAAAGIHPVLVGLSEALKGTPLAIGNYQAAKDMFSQEWLHPMWRSLCAAFAPLVDPPPGPKRKDGKPSKPNTAAELWYDSTDVTFLAQDREAEAQLQLAQAQTASALVMAGWKPDTIAQFFLNGGDWNVLEHSGLVSVQMQPTDGSGGNSPPPPDTPVPPVGAPTPPGQNPVAPVPPAPGKPPVPPVPNPNGKPPSTKTAPNKKN